jgi:hypothetical protein
MEKAGCESVHVYSEARRNTSTIALLLVWNTSGPTYNMSDPS